MRFDPAQTDIRTLTGKVRDVGYEPVTAELNLPITGMTCANCVGRVERALSKVGGVLSASVNLASERAHLQYLPATTAPGQLRAAVREAGYGVLEADTGTASVDTQRAAREAEVRHLRSQVVFSAVFAVPLLLIAMLPMLVPALDAALMRACAHDGPQLDHAGAGRPGAVRPRTALLPPGLGQPEAPQPRYERAGDDRHVRRLLLQPGGHPGPAALPGGHARTSTFEASGVVITLILLGKYFEAVAKGRSSEAMKTLLSLQPKEARVLRGAEELLLPVDEVQVGDVLRVLPGESIPLDGEVQSGQSYVDESMITGESVPIHKVQGAAVIGGTLNGNGALTLRVTRVGS